MDKRQTLTFDLTGKVALVTGAARGIGAAIALGLASAGALVVVNDLDGEAAKQTADLIVQAGKRAIGLAADVSRPEPVERLFAETRQLAGRLDILVCNAGITDAHDIFTIKPADWERVLGVNLTGPFLCAQKGLEIMREQRQGGRLIFIGSGVVHQGALLGHVAYAAAKGGVHSMARTLARTAAPLGVTVNVVAPGITDTILLRDTHSKDEIDAITHTVPLGIGLPEDVASAVVYLSSEAASHITGVTLDVNGGQIIR